MKELSFALLFLGGTVHCGQATVKDREVECCSITVKGGRCKRLSTAERWIKEGRRGGRGGEEGN